MKIQIHEPIPPMLLQIATEIPKQKHIHQLKADGFRCLLSFDHKKGVQLFTLNQNESTALFPELHIELPVKQAVLDGEIIVLQQGKMILEHSLKRLKASHQSQVQKLQKQLPVQYAAFDLIHLNEPIHHSPIEKRLNCSAS
jgi:DNA ligase 1